MVATLEIESFAAGSKVSEATMVSRSLRSCLSFYGQYQAKRTSSGQVIEGWFEEFLGWSLKRNILLGLEKIHSRKLRVRESLVTACSMVVGCSNPEEVYGSVLMMQSMRYLPKIPSKNQCF